MLIFAKKFKFFQVLFILIEHKYDVYFFALISILFRNNILYYFNFFYAKKKRINTISSILINCFVVVLFLNLMLSI